MEPKVFKMPDGKGGTLYQILTPDGQWLDTDENGNVLSKPEEEKDASLSAPQKNPEGRKKKAKRGASLKDSSIVNFTLHFPAADFKEYSDYIHWRCLFKEECSKVGFLMDLAMDTIRKDRDYREFRKRNA